MAGTGKRQLVVIDGPLKRTMPILVAVEQFLLHASIEYEKQHGRDREDGTERHRYFVPGKDLERASEVLSIVKDLQDRANAA